MEEIVKLIIPFLIFLFFIFRTLSQRKAKTQEEAELIASTETEEENEGTNEKEMSKGSLQRWFTEERKITPNRQRRVSERYNADLYQPEKHKEYQPKVRNSITKNHTVEETSSSQTSPLICLRSKEDAKRAFLYAEIFNRKY